MNEGRTLIALIQRVYIKKPAIGDPVEIQTAARSGVFSVYDVGEVKRDIAGREYYELFLKRSVDTAPAAILPDKEQEDRPA